MKTMLLVMLLCLAHNAWSHQTSNSFIELDADRTSGRIDISITDLQRERDLDLDDDQQITWQEVQNQFSALNDYVQPRVVLSANQQPCALSWQPPAFTRHADAAYLAFRFSFRCPTPPPWDVDYRILFERDALHRGFLHWRAGADDGLAMLSPDAPRYRLGKTPWWRVFMDYFRHGILHLLVGYDHILFLLALLLPAAEYVVKNTGNVTATRPPITAALRPALRDTLGIVTLFTLAHSCTLALAALDILRLPPQAVEIMIALSVSGAGLAAIVPALHRYRYALAFGFGLVHGFGFANVLADLAPSFVHRVVSLAAFNLGVEAGQALLISLALPLLLLVRRPLLRYRWSLPGSATGIIICGLLWTWQRL